MKDISRRGFVSHLLTGAGAALALSAIPNFAAAHEHAAAQVKSEARKLEFFTPAEAADLDAFCAQIIPSGEDGPGAREAGSLYFIDYVAKNTQHNLQPRLREGLKQLAADSAPKRFAELTSEQQIEIMKKHEHGREFRTLRAYTIIGFLGDPKYGGNRNEMGWKYIGFENPGMFSPPFGYYDAQLLSNKKEGE
jgi:gluconate 2-dehydrogenase gamma chain